MLQRFGGLTQASLSSIYHYSVIPNIFATLKKESPRASLFQPWSPPLSSWQPLTLSLSPNFTFFQNVINGTIRYAAFSDSLFSSVNLHLRFIHALVWLNSSFFLLLDNIFLYRCTTVCLRICWLKDSLVVFSFWKLWIKLLQTSTYKILCGHKFSYQLGKYPEVRLLDSMVKLCLAL